VCPFLARVVNFEQSISSKCNDIQLSCVFLKKSGPFITHLDKIKLLIPFGPALAVCNTALGAHRLLILCDQRVT